ncbi:hypothetical protein DERF_013377 [Dermatophagoides farinae]|uniref:Uncharacterized protein n=1 Tax=Dermatophagoides farinae TaxID=6954 RepID=A0A922HM20_DERFA|nr:hypothetical protein DERF_013377 [Dermatophagoides farinae]
MAPQTITLKPLKFINSHKNPNTRIMNWALKLNQYNYKIEYISGKENTEADFLSRNPSFQINLLTMEQISEVQEFISTPPPRCVLYNGFYVRYTDNRRRLSYPCKNQIYRINRGQNLTINKQTVYFTKMTNGFTSHIIHDDISEILNFQAFNSFNSTINLHDLSTMIEKEDTLINKIIYSYIQSYYITFI